jgi:hypothetical protein
MPTPSRTIADASPAYAWIAAIANGILSLIGISAAAYVYLEFPHPAIVQHSGRWSVQTESIESYIFTYPALHILLFVVLAVKAVRWKTELASAVSQEALQKAKNPRLQRLDSILVYNLAGLLTVAIGVYVLLGLTLPRVSVVANNSF